MNNYWQKTLGRRLSRRRALIGASALGWVADHWGLPTALGISAAMPIAGFVAALFLPDPKTGEVG